jgi:aspartyl-tRNA synthetase
MKTTIAQLNGFVGQEVTLSGWVYHSRHSGKVAFIVLRDGTGTNGIDDGGIKNPYVITPAELAGGDRVQ